jgi:hypothetical protein
LIAEKIKRLKVKEGAVVIPKSDFHRQYKIVDISKVGLAFRYSESGDRSIRLSESDELTINLADEGFCLDNMPSKTISDFTLTDDAPHRIYGNETAWYSVWRVDSKSYRPVGLF